jgi:hypothetical protein
MVATRKQMQFEVAHVGWFPLDHRVRGRRGVD